MADSDREERARRNRELFPESSLVLDEFRNVFGAGCQITYAEEGGRSVGKRSEERLSGKWVSLGDMVISNQAKREKAR